jgi:hypothetical protein
MGKIIILTINRLINALELFSGLIIFAESKFEEKARFLFDLFDFNELNSLSLVMQNKYFDRLT